MKTLRYSNVHAVKYSPRVVVIFLSDEKSKVKILILSFFFFFFLTHISKSISVYKRSAHQMTMLLSEIIFSWLELQHVRQG